MTERSKQIFGNDIAPGAYKKAVRSKQKFIRKFGDDSTKNYPTSIKANPYIGPELGVSDIRVGEEGAADFHTEKGIIVGNIRMGFGHYRISMAIASAAHALGYEPYWMDLNSYGQTTCTKVIGAQNDLYSMGSRLSQKSRLFNRLVWEPMNYEGFRKLTYNAADQKNEQKVKVLDLCTGSGCIGISIAHYKKNTDVELFDISDIALETAEKNIKRNKI